MTQYQKILTIMLRDQTKWFYPYEFMNPALGDLYVGYKAPTRMSELNKSYPYLFETKQVDKYVQRRINAEQYDRWYEYLDADLQEVVDREFTPTIFQGKEVTQHAISWLNEED